MSGEPADRAAALLLRAREQGVALDAAATDLRLKSRADAYRVQTLVAAQLGPVAGWKVGTPSPRRSRSSRRSSKISSM